MSGAAAARLGALAGRAARAEQIAVYRHKDDQFGIGSVGAPAHADHGIIPVLAPLPGLMIWMVSRGQV